MRRPGKQIDAWKSFQVSRCSLTVYCTLKSQASRADHKLERVLLPCLEGGAPRGALEEPHTPEPMARGPASPRLAVLGQIDTRFEGAPGWGVEKQAALTSCWSPGFNWLNKSPRGGKSTELTQARVQGGPRGAASTNVFAVGLGQCCPLHTTPLPPLSHLPWESSPKTRS